MRSRLPRANDFDAFTTVELDAHGRLMSGGNPVTPAEVTRQLSKILSIPAQATDIFVFVHGWQHNMVTASAGSRLLFSAVSKIRLREQTRYPALSDFRPFFVSIHWPSRSSPLPSGYRKIRDRAHAMTTEGHAAHVIAALLGYLDLKRQRPPADGTLGTSTGQYLHCIGHSFGCRMLGEAIKTAADPPDNPTLKWPWATGFPFAVDSFLGFQMAAPPDIFANCLLPLVDGTAPIAGPVALTFSRHDRALSAWHRIPEGVPGLGATGAAGAHTVRLNQLNVPYTTADFAKLTNVDASWLYRHGVFAAQGAHSDFWHPESIHLLLSLASLCR